MSDPLNKTDKELEEIRRQKMREVNAVLKMTADNMGCKVSDLQYKIDRGGHIHIRNKKNAV